MATVEQHCPINVGATALEHRSGTIDTNRASAIQIEIVGFAKDAAQFSDKLLANLAALMRWIEAQTGINGSAYRQFTDTPVRFSDSDWRSFNGWCGHQHVPNQAHWDPGSLQFTKLLPSSAVHASAAPAAALTLGTPQVFGDDDVIRQVVTTPALGPDGNGWVPLDIPFEKFVNLLPFGPAPQRDTYSWSNWYWAVNNTDGKVEIEIEGGTPGKPVSFAVWYAK